MYVVEQEVAAVGACRQSSSGEAWVTKAFPLLTNV